MLFDFLRCSAARFLTGWFTRVFAGFFFVRIVARESPGVWNRTVGFLPICR